MLYDVLIIGAGCTGVMTARLLSTKNVKVAVAEAGPDVATGATAANSAIVARRVRSSRSLHSK